MGKCNFKSEKELVYILDNIINKIIEHENRFRKDIPPEEMRGSAKNVFTIMY